VRHDLERKSDKIGIGSRGRRIPRFWICFAIRAVNETGQSVRSSQLIPIFLVNAPWDKVIPPGGTREDTVAVMIEWLPSVRNEQEFRNDRVARHPSHVRMKVEEGKRCSFPL